MVPSASSEQSDANPAAPPMVVALLVVAWLVAIRVFAPEDFDGHQGRQISATMDILHGGSLLMQYDSYGEIATKPPLYAVVTAFLSVVAQSREAWVFKFPALVCGLALLWLTYLLAKKWVGPPVAFWTIATAAASHHIAYLFWYARTDTMMVLWTFLAIYLIQARPMTPARAALIGIITALNVFTKGPVGPALVLLWLPLWAWDNGTLGKWRQALKPLGIALGAAALLVVPWFAAVLRMPQFVEVILGTELVNNVTGEDLPERPVWYYLKVLLERNLPVSLFAIGAVAMAWRTPDWKRVRYLALWVLIYVVFFSLAVSRRGDRILPAYPPFFMLAGYFLDRVLAHGHHRKVFAVGAAAALFLLAAPILKQDMWLGTGYPVLAVTLAVSGMGFGALALLSIGLRRPGAVILCVLCGWMPIQGLNLAGFLGNERLQDSENLRRFAANVKSIAGDDPVLVFDADRLVPYALDVHPRGARLDDFPPGTYRWLVTRPEHESDIEEKSGLSLEPVETLIWDRDAGDHVLYRLEPRPAGSDPSAPDSPADSETRTQR